MIDTRKHLNTKPQPMTEQEYRAKLSKLEQIYKAKKKELHLKYAKANNPYKIGDIVKDYIGALRIEKVQVYIGFSGVPECAYTGTELNKDGNPAKKQTGRAVYQSNIIG